MTAERRFFFDLGRRRDESDGPSSAVGDIARQNKLNGFEDLCGTGIRRADRGETAPAPWAYGTGAVSDQKVIPNSTPNVRGWIGAADTWWSTPVSRLAMVFIEV